MRTSTDGSRVVMTPPVLARAPRRTLSLALVALMASLALMGFGASSALAIEKGDLDQCANGPLTAPVQCLTTNWENGNLNGSKAHYLEGQSVPYRLKLTDLNVGTFYNVQIEWDTTQGGDHALDYLTSFDRSLAARSSMSPNGKPHRTTAVAR